MKAPSIAVAVLIGLVAYPNSAQAVNLQASVMRAPRTATLIRHREEEFQDADTLDQDIESQMAQENEEELSDRAEQESVVRRMHQQSRNANLAQHHEVEEDDEDQDEKIQRKSKEMEEDDEFI